MNAVKRTLGLDVERRVMLHAEDSIFELIVLLAAPQVVPVLTLAPSLPGALLTDSAQSKPVLLWTVFLTCLCQLVPFFHSQLYLLPQC